MARNMNRFGSRYTSLPADYAGDGFVGGVAPTSSDPDADDGRARKLNVPAAIKVVLFDRQTMRAVAETTSKSDGTWQIVDLSRKRNYFVIGFDGPGQVNAAIQDWVVPAKME